MTIPDTTPWTWRVVRFVLGAYLAVHYFALAPFADELFSRSGVLGDPSMLPTWPWFPNPLFLVEAPPFARGFVAVLGVLGILLACGVRASAVAVLLWFGGACLVTRNVFIRNPGMPYVGWMLLAVPFVETAASSIRTSGAGRRGPIPAILMLGAWGLLAVGYTLSGLHKLQSPSWQDGTALARLFENPLARPTLFGAWVQSLPEDVLRCATWGTLALEVLAVPFAFFRRTRPWMWTAFMLMHVGIMLSVDFVDLTLGMVMIHLFVFDPAWIPPRPAREPAIVFFDGVCNLCNGFVSALMEEDGGRNLRYASLQGETARSFGLTVGEGAQASVVVVVDGVRHVRSDAVLAIAASLGGLWRLLTVFRFLPRSFRDAAYRFIAARRYALFGSKSTCRVPTPAERGYFLP